MLIVFFDIHGTVHRDFVPQGPNTKFYCEVLRRLRENIRQKQPDLWSAKNWILHDDNEPCHRALLAREFLANHNLLSLPHPPYSPHLAPADFFLLPMMKMQLKGRRVHIVAEIQRESQKVTDPLHKMISRPHSSSGKNGVIAVLLRKVIISKDMVFKLR
jgi:histone-lysine N-methyltransferase SETMAR